MLNSVRNSRMTTWRVCSPKEWASIAAASSTRSRPNPTPIILTSSLWSERAALARCGRWWRKLRRSSMRWSRCRRWKSCLRDRSTQWWTKGSYLLSWSILFWWIWSIRSRIGSICIWSWIIAIEETWGIISAIIGSSIKQNRDFS